MPRRPVSVPQARGVEWDIPSRILARWSADLRPRAEADAATIEIFDAIGVDPWTGDGWTAKRLSGALRNIGAARDVTVRINSPGGDVFEGLSMYNLLAGHGGRVRVEVFGIAASIASVITLAGDEIVMAPGSFMMVHRAWGVTVGNEADHMEAVDLLRSIDGSLASVYAQRGVSEDDVRALMAAETWMNAAEAVEAGFADRIGEALEAEATEGASASIAALRIVDRALAKAGHTRARRRALIKDLSTPSAAQTATPSAGGADVTPGADVSKLVAAMGDLTQRLRG